MIFNMVGGGSGSNPFAMVLINYPQGSTFTEATNVEGFKDIFPSSSANPQRLYYVSTPSGSTQTCVFTITDGTQTATKTVDNITEGTGHTISLEYALILLEHDVQYSTELWTVENNNTVTMLDNGYWRYSRNGNPYIGFYIASINLSGYNNLYVQYTALHNGDGFLIYETNKTTVVINTSMPSSSELKTLTIDVSAINRNVCITPLTSSTSSIDFYKIWLTE